ncbi:dnaJ domain-containing protein [Ditylenchus destructor]|nr:dnaJ domain-containing protein [Ditylenchus destructor]
MSADQKYFDVLQIPRTATDEEIKKAYRALALKNKNDGKPDAEVPSRNASDSLYDSDDRSDSSSSDSDHDSSDSDSSDDSVTSSRKKMEQKARKMAKKARKVAKKLDKQFSKQLIKETKNIIHSTRRQPAQFTNQYSRMPPRRINAQRVIDSVFVNSRPTVHLSPRPCPTFMVTPVPPPIPVSQL